MNSVRNRFDVRVPMRDGVELSADVWMPEPEGQYPAVVLRTPYIKSARPPEVPFDNMLAYLAHRGYVVVYQDVRGRGDSDGKFGVFFADAQDGYDTVEWVAAQPWCNGQVGMMGVSYLGTVQWLAAKELPPHLVCLVSTAAAELPMDEIGYLGGAFQMAHSLNWLNDASGQTSQGAVVQHIDWEKVYQHRPLLTMDEALGRKMPHYQDFLTHSTLDEYWRQIKLGPKDFRNIDLPVLHVTGWFDGDQLGAMHYWDGMAAHSPAKDSQYLLVGPWNHVQTFIGGGTRLGHMEFTPDSVVDNMALHLAFFEHYLKGAAPEFDFPRARVYVTGANEWREFDAYPPRQVKERRLYLHSGGRANSLVGDGILSWERPGDEPPDTYAYDPHRPVPATIGMEYYAVDHRPIERRDDVLVYTSDSLEEPLEIIGRVFVELYAATDALDTDWTAKILDVYPDGRAIMLGVGPVGIVRARYRNGLEREELLTLHQVERYRISLRDIGHRFLPGHRVRIEVSSSAYPVINPNQNTGNPVATDTQWQVAHQTVYHDQTRPSCLILPVMLDGKR